ncbi:MAG: KEOPS complex subunit Pcc1 [archaeon]|nr:KEOPS complex subunit Pcc1 [archaeon]
MPAIEKRFEFPDEQSAIFARRAVLAETGKGFEKRSKTGITTNKNVVLLKITASDDSALKASLNSYSRLLGLCKRLAKED